MDIQPVPMWLFLRRHPVPQWIQYHSTNITLTLTVEEEKAYCWMKKISICHLIHRKNKIEEFCKKG